MMRKYIRIRMSIRFLEERLSAVMAANIVAFESLYAALEKKGCCHKALP